MWRKRSSKGRPAEIDVSPIDCSQSEICSWCHPIGAKLADLFQSICSISWLRIAVKFSCQSKAVQIVLPRKTHLRIMTFALISLIDAPHLPLLSVRPVVRRSCSSLIVGKPKSARANRLDGSALAHFDGTARVLRSAICPAATR